MQPIPVKINTRQSDDTRTMRPNSQNQNGKEGRPKKTGKRFFFWFLLILVIVESGSIAFLYLTNVTPPFYSLLPENPVATAYFSRSNLIILSASLKDSQAKWTPISSALNSYKDFMGKNNVDTTEISSVLDDKMALVLLAPSNSNQPIWLFFSTLKNSAAEVASILEKTKKTLKQNFNLVSDTYRQIDIEEIKSLDQNQASIFFAQPKNLFLLSNDSQTLKNTIDKALKQGN